MQYSCWHHGEFAEILSQCQLQHAIFLYQKLVIITQCKYTNTFPINQTQNFDYYMLLIQIVCNATLLASIADLRMENAMDYFCSSRHHCSGFTGQQVCDGQLLQFRCNSILYNWPHDFLNAQICSPRGHLSDHNAECGWI